MMLNFEKIQTILSQISYKDWEFHLGISGSIIWMQVRFKAQDNSNPSAWEIQHGRKWILSPHMTKSEVVQTALLAVLTAEEHEAREKFTFRGEETFNPHFDIDRLHQLASDEAVDIRKPMISREALDRMIPTSRQMVRGSHRDLGIKPRITNNLPHSKDHA